MENTERQVGPKWFRSSLRMGFLIFGLLLVLFVWWTFVIAAMWGPKYVLFAQLFISLPALSLVLLSVVYLYENPSPELFRWARRIAAITFVMGALPYLMAVSWVWFLRVMPMSLYYIVIGSLLPITYLILLGVSGLISKKFLAMIDDLKNTPVP